MKIILYMAISIDGYIAKSDGDSDWVSETDYKIFEEKISQTGCIIVGRKTFEQYYDDLYPIKNITNIVLSRSSHKSRDNNVIFVSSPEEAIQVAEERAHKEALLIGGGHVNSSFLKSTLIDEIFLSVHPIILGKGIKLFENFKNNINLKFIKSEELEEGLLQLHYQVIKD